MWSFVVPATWLAFFATPDQLARLSAPANALLMTLFLVHYFNRCGSGRCSSQVTFVATSSVCSACHTAWQSRCVTLHVQLMQGAPRLTVLRSDFIFPLRLRGGKPTPFTVWLMAAVFCIYNGYMQASYHVLVRLS